MSNTSLDELWYRIVLGVHATEQLLSGELEAAGVPGAYFGVLRRLLAAPEQRLPMSRISRDLHMTTGGFTKLADRMARDGLIDRRGSDQDRRVVNARLTAEGEHVARRAIEVHRAALERLIGDAVNADDLATAAAVLTTLRSTGAVIGAEADPDEDPSSPASGVLSPAFGASGGVERRRSSGH